MELVVPSWWGGWRWWRTSCGMQWGLQPLAFYNDGKALMLLAPKELPYGKPAEPRDGGEG